MKLNKFVGHIESFVENTNWDINIKDGQLTFDVNFPSVDHLSTDKKINLEDILELFMTEHIVPVYLVPALEIFRLKVLNRDTCYGLKIFIKMEEDERRCKGLRSIKGELKHRIFLVTK